MTVIMLGVVQVFGIVMQTASDAQGIHFAQQQLRALLNRLHNDLRGMTREGYLKIRRGSTQPGDPFYTFNPAPANPMPASAYACDTLAFVTIGQCASAFAEPAYEGTAAEVVYTNNVKTPDNPLNVDGRPVDARRGILGRGQWMMTGKTGSAGDFQDTSAASYLCDLFKNQQNSGGGDRISNSGGYVQVYPWTTMEGFPTDLSHTKTLKRVMASCVSEFHVEAFDPKADTTGYFDITNNQYDYTWSTCLEAGVPVNDKAWPRAIRVTVAVHDPADNELPQAGADNRFRGFALQEVFWLTDP